MSSLETLKRVFERSLDAVEIVDAMGRFAHVNAAFERATGYANAEVVGRTPGEVLRSGAHPPAFYESIWNAIMSGQAVATTMVSRRKDGRHVTHELSLTPYLDASGAIEWIVGVRRDATERIAREESYRRAASLYEQIFAQNPAIKLLIDPVSGRIVDANEAAVRFYGWPREALVGMGIDAINTLTADEVRDEMHSAAQQRRTHFRFVHRVASGEHRNVEIFTGPVHVEGEVRLLSIVQDVTQRERLEQELRRAQRMEAVGRMAGGVAHDFNNLLQVVFNSTTLIARHMREDDPSRVHLERIDDASHRGADLTRQLLLFSRGDTSEAPRVDLHDVLASATGLLRATLGANVELVVDSLDAPGDVLPVRIPRASFEQVVLNLVVNARDAIEGTGRIHVLAGRRTLARDAVPRLPSGEYALLEVSDDGAGMTADVLAHAFEPFFSTKAEGRGTGLGLAILYGVVQRAGGAVVLHSEPRVGTTFRVYLPIDEGTLAARRSSPPAPRTLDGAPLSVLLVEDEDDVRDALAAILLDDGLVVHAARDVDHALELATTHRGRIDVLLTDVVMPKLTGPELAERILALDTRVEVLFMSGFPGDSFVHGTTVGARLLPKPFGDAELLAAVRGARSKLSG